MNVVSHKSGSWIFETIIILFISLSYNRYVGQECIERLIIISIIGIASATILFNLGNAGGEAGHLGGIIMGAIIMAAWKYRSRYNQPW